jgi:uncharacterized protein (TIGR02246 family)
MKGLRSRIEGIFAAIPLCLLIALAHAGDQSNRAKREIEALEMAHNKALVRGDVAALASMMSDDYTLITSRGDLRTRAEVLRIFSNPKFNFEFREIKDLNIRVYGDTAVVIGRSAQTAQKDGSENSEAYVYTRVYVRHGDGWLAVALQMTRVDPL